jgi:hypothetical protein
MSNSDQGCFAKLKSQASLNSPVLTGSNRVREGEVSAEAIDLDRPPDVCITCWTIWRGRRPRPTALFCSHFGVVARPRSDGWQLLGDVTGPELAGMRAKGLL